MALNVGILYGVFAGNYADIKLNDGVKFKLVTNFWESNPTFLQNNSKNFANFYPEVEEPLTFNILGNSPNEVQSNVHFLTMAFNYFTGPFDELFATPLLYVNPSGVDGAGLVQTGVAFPQDLTIHTYASPLNSATLILPSNWTHQASALNAVLGAKIVYSRKGLWVKYNDYAYTTVGSIYTLNKKTSSLNNAQGSLIQVSGLRLGTAPTAFSTELKILPTNVNLKPFNGFITAFNATYGDIASVRGDPTVTGITELTNGTSPVGSILRAQATGTTPISFLSTTIGSARNGFIQAVSAKFLQIRVVDTYCAFRVVSGVWAVNANYYNSANLRQIGASSPVVLESTTNPQYVYLGHTALNDNASTILVDTVLTPVTSNGVIELDQTHCIFNADVQSINVQYAPLTQISGTAPLSINIYHNVLGEKFSYPESTYLLPSVQIREEGTFAYYALAHYGDANFYVRRNQFSSSTNTLTLDDTIGVFPMLLGGHVSSGWSHTTASGSTFYRSTTSATISAYPTYTIVPEL